ncbi:3-isopropylmalate dehydratase large subunit [Limobrevibacterium gyesilva]|uniref:3-isopropylmalate dehydratase large subunit n=1 Tax=Limobrevibacterium gyesilva TaxID=2991712 RepID=A0AA42CET0_9PROT|nr:3-isopropylmalate dehydratase large subunit [Limobrevibacterium gyesilva]MCW3475669.1 3-isopropylmalate dehydratase large subunit [Limobrevibacterium gyesilva]
MTAVEKIFAAHAGKAGTAAGEIVTARIDRILLHDITGALAIDLLAAMGADRVVEPDRVVLVGDHYSPPPDPTAAGLLSLMERFAAEKGIRHLFTTGEGIEHTLLPEQGLLRPGDLVIGTDSHTCTAGAFGAVGTGMGSSDIAAAMALGELWFKVPETIRVTMTGARRRYVTGKDLILQVLGAITADGATYKCLEFQGDTIEGLNLDERMALCNMAVEAGAKTAFVPPDDKTRHWAREKHGDGGMAQAVWSDPDATFQTSLDFDAGAVEPLCARPYAPDNVAPVAATAGVRLNQVYIGNCANGTLTDLRQAAEILAGRRVAKGVRCIVVPATRQIYRDAMREGVLEILAAAGAIIGPSTCGACAGLHMGVLAEDQVAVATTNRNYRGRMGAHSSQVYLANAYVAAASAVAGELIHPAEVTGA